jgi:hypothetical protein
MALAWAKIRKKLRHTYNYGGHYRKNPKKPIAFKTFSNEKSSTMKNQYVREKPWARRWVNMAEEKCSRSTTSLISQILNTLIYSKFHNDNCC